MYFLPTTRRRTHYKFDLRRRIASIAIVLVGAIALLGLTAVGASAAPTTGTISGHVADGVTNATMSNVPIYLGGMGALSNSLSTNTDSTGYYEFDNLPFGYYQISLQGDYNYPDIHETPAYITVHLTASSSTSVNDIAFPRWPTGTSSVSGTITMSDTSAPVSGVQVQLTAFPDGLPEPQTYDSEQVTTNASGHYEIDNLPPYSYTLELQFPQTLGSYDFNGPLVDVTSDGESVVRDQQITPWQSSTSSVSGTIVDHATGDPISGASVDLDSLDNGSTYSGTTGADGSFDFPAVVPGSFTIDVTDSGYASYQPMLGVFEYQSDDLGTIGLHALDATISGTVEDTGSNRLSGAGVYAQLTTDENVGEYISTNPDGTYSLTGLEAGTYSVSVGDDGWIQKFQTITVAANGTATANFTLVPDADGGSISGTVRDSNGNPLAGICEATYDSSGNIVSSDPYSPGTGPDGVYAVPDLDAGTYTILFSDCNSLLTHTSTYLGGVYDLADGHLVTLTLGENSTGSGNDVVMGVGGTIGGHVDVSAPGGYVPFPDGSLIVPVVQQYVHGTWVDWVNETNLAGIGAGDYQVHGLPPGQFRLEFEDTNEGVRTYETQWWSSSNAAGIATPNASSIITLAAGQVYTDKDAHMQIPIPGSEPAPLPGDPTTNDDNISSVDQAAQGQTITVNVGDGLSGDWVSVWGHSTPQLMSSWAQVSSTGTVTVAVPTDLAVGPHHLVAQTSDGTLLGSVPLTVTAALPAAPPAGKPETGLVGRTTPLGSDAVTPVSTATPGPTSSPEPTAPPATHKPSAAAPPVHQAAASQSTFPLWLVILIAGLILVVALIVLGFVRIARTRR